MVKVGPNLVWNRSDQLEGTSAECHPTLHSLVNVGPTSVEIAPTLVDVGPNVAEIGQLWQRWVQFGRNPGPTLADVG